MIEARLYDTAIVGGGLAGLALAIQMSREGHKVVLFEKEVYPFHKVCGEYISMESFPFLETLGVPLSTMSLPRINKLIVTAPDGTELNAPLPLGGFGISRYKLDAMLKDIAVNCGVEVHEGCRVNELHFKDDQFAIETDHGRFYSKLCCGSFGKKSNIDVKWKRSFTLQQNKRLNQFAGIKYHVEADFAADTIALHNFSNGYCGISRIEENKYCLCYLTHTDNLKHSDQSIEKMEELIMSANPQLKKLLLESRRLFSKPVTIAQISFLQKSQVENHVILLGDAAGMITPLCGNGMSMALHSSKIAAGFVSRYLKQQITRAQLEAGYSSSWKKEFAQRLRYGRLIQYFFGKTWMTNLFVRSLKKSPASVQWLIRQTHGEVF